MKRLIWGSVEDHASMPLDVHAHWSDVARRLMLQPMQIMSLLQLRSGTLETLSTIYAQRKVGSDVIP